MSAQFHRILLALILPSLLPLISSYSENAIGEYIGFVPLKRVKRGEHDMLDFNSPSTFPPNYEIEDENKETPEEEMVIFIFSKPEK